MAAVLAMAQMSYAVAGSALLEVSPGHLPSNALLPISVVIAAKNEARNLPHCLESLQGVAEIYVVDSQSTDQTAQIAEAAGAKVIQFHYAGGWPKKRQWALDTLPLACEWVLLLDADEALTPQLFVEMRMAIRDNSVNGYYLGLDMFFLGKRLRHSGASFCKLALFRHRKAKFECRARQQDSSMCDMEVHEHLIADGATQRLKHRLLHHNVESLDRYIHKHNQYSNWEARVWFESRNDEQQIEPALFGTQAQRRRWLRKRFFGLPGSPILFFLYKYFWRLGFLDGVPGLIYCAFQGIQFFHIKAKIYELKHALPETSFRLSPEHPTPELTHVRH